MSRRRPARSALASPRLSPRVGRWRRPPAAAGAINSPDLQGVADLYRLG